LVIVIFGLRLQKAKGKTATTTKVLQPTEKIYLRYPFPIMLILNEHLMTQLMKVVSHLEMGKNLSSS